MKKLLILGLFSAFGLTAQAQDFKIIDYVKGFDQPHPADKQTKINVMKARQALTTYDFDKDGTVDTILYRLSSSGGQTAIITVFDAKQDDWVNLYKMSLDKWEGEEGMWFYQLNEGAAPPRLLIYTARKSDKFLTIITYDPVKKAYSSKEYKLNPKNLFPHMYVVNKKKIRNHNGSNSGERDAYDEIQAE